MKSLIKQDEAYSDFVRSRVSSRLARFVGGLASGSAPLDWSMLEDCKQSDGSIFRVLPSVRSYDDQCDIYKKGRIVEDRREPVGNSYRRIRGNERIVVPSAVSTYAWGGQSYHNFGLAVDIVVRQVGELPKGATVSLKSGETFPTVEAFYERLGLLKWAKDCGLEWGGYWDKPYDPVHFQDSNYRLPLNPTASECSFSAVAGQDVHISVDSEGRAKASGGVGVGLVLAVAGLLAFLLWGCVS